MPKSISEDVSNLIVEALQRGLSRQQIAGVIGVSRRAITRISTNLRTHGQAKAPPSGLKQGRPIKMSEAQANAMLGWIAGRDYAFYIKDLTQFLTDKHAFKGCDGTVRRALLRAGFKRKLKSTGQLTDPRNQPWHKSEVTPWVPPDGPPDLSFVMNPNPPAKSKKYRLTAPAPAPAPAPDPATTSSIDVEMGDDSANVVTESQMLKLRAQAETLARMRPGAEQHQGIDPGLEAATLPTSSPHRVRQIVPTVPSMVAPRAPSETPPMPLQTVPTPDPPGFFPTPRKRAPRRPRAPKTTTAALQPQQPQAPPVDPNLVTTLQSEVARQQELIVQLQRQLAQGPPASPATSLPLTTTNLDPAPGSASAEATSVAATATAAMNASEQVLRQEQQQQREKTDEEANGIAEGDAQPSSGQLTRLRALIDAAGPLTPKKTAAMMPRGVLKVEAADSDDEDDGEVDDDSDAI